MATYAEQMKKFFHNARTRDIQAHSAKVHSVAWSCDGRRLASGSFDKTVCIYMIDRDRLVSYPNNGCVHYLQLGGALQVETNESIITALDADPNDKELEAIKRSLSSTHSTPRKPGTKSKARQ